MNQEITQQVIEIVATQLEMDPTHIKPESSFTEDLKADSLAVVELVLALEEAFGIEIPDEDTESIKTVKDAITYIEAHKN
jgi:acyl carrier protein